MYVRLYGSVVLTWLYVLCEHHNTDTVILRSHANTIHTWPCYEYMYIYVLTYSDNVDCVAQRLFVRCL